MNTKFLLVSETIDSSIDFKKEEDKYKYAKKGEKIGKVLYKLSKLPTTKKSRTLKLLQSVGDIGGQLAATLKYRKSKDERKV